MPTHDTRRYRALFTLLLAGVLLAPSAQAQPAADEAPLKLGFFPIISTVALFKRFLPLTEYLSAELGRPVVMETAKDFPTFAKRTAQGRYDIVVTAPHFAVRAADSGLYDIRATLTSDVQQLVVVRTDSPVRHLTELAGKHIATPPARALITMMGHDHLAQAGLLGDQAPEYHPFLSHNAANEAVVAGQADAAIASSNIVNKAIAQGAPLRILDKGLKLPNMATLVARDMPPALADRVETILLDMTNSEAGRAALRAISMPGYRSVRAIDYRPARPFAYRSPNAPAN